MLRCLYSLAVDSEEPLLGLACAADSPADVRVERRSSWALPGSRPEWFSERRLPGGARWLSVAKVQEGYLLQFEGLADFLVSRSGGDVSCVAGSEIPSETMRHLLVDQVIPMVLTLRGREALHASGVLTPQGAVAFVGPTGSGKSTLAGSFLTAGDSLLSDDCLALGEHGGRIDAIPAYPGLRLWPDARAWLFGENGVRDAVAHYTTKERVRVETEPGTYCAEPQALARVYLLASSAPPEEGRIEIQHLPARETFLVLIRSALRLDTTDRAALARQFRFLFRVVSEVPVRRLVFPRKLEVLHAVREMILADLEALE
jgi:hypothetical protein